MPRVRSIPPKKRITPRTGVLLDGLDRTVSFWEMLRYRANCQAGLRGINAAVVGPLLVALYDPVWTSAISGPPDVVLVLVAALGGALIARSGGRAKSAS